MALLRTISSTSSWAALPSFPTGAVSILNSTGEALEIRYAGDTDTDEQITIPDGGNVGLPVIANSKEIQIKATTGAAGVNLIIT